MRLRCPYCTKSLSVADDLGEGEVHCPGCGGRVTVRAATADGVSKTCPECSALMDAKAVLCVKCGYNLKSRRKLTTERRPPDRHVDAGAPLVLRAVLASVVGLGGAALLVAHLAYNVVDQFGVILGLVLVGAFLLILGSFTRVTVTADEQGKWWIKKTDLLCFIRLKETRHDPAAYDALYISYKKRFGGVGWGGTLALLFVGLLGGGLLFAHGGRVERFTLTLGRDVILYRGRDENAMRAVIELIQAVTDLRCARAGDA